MQRWRGIFILCFLLSACSSQPEPIGSMPSPTPVTKLASPPNPTALPTDIPAVIPTPPESTPIPTANPSGLVQPFPLLGTATPAREQATRPLPEPMTSPSDANQLKPWRTLGFGGVSSPEFTPDGSRLAVATGIGIVYLDPQSLEITQIHTFTNADLQLSSGALGEIKDLYFDPTGTTMHVAIGEWYGWQWEWKQFSVADGLYLGPGIALEPPTNAMPDRIIESPTQTYQAELPPLDSVVIPGVKIRRSADGHVLYEDTLTLEFAFEPQDRYLAMTGTDDRLRVIDWETLQTSDRPFEAFSGVIFSPDGQYLLTASDSLAVWDVVTGNMLYTVEIPGLNHVDASVFQMSYDSTGQFLTVLVNLTGFEQTKINRYTFQIHAPDNYELIWDGELWRGINSIVNYAFNPALNQHAISHRDGEMFLAWHTDGEIMTQTVDFMTTALEFAPTGTTLAAATEDNRLLLLDTSDYSTIQTIQTTEPLQMINFDPTASLIAGKAESGAILVWRVADGSLIAEMPDVPSTYLARRGMNNMLFLTNEPMWILRPSEENLAVIDPQSQMVGTIDGMSSMAAIGPFRRLIVSLNRGVVTLWGRP